MPKNVKHLSKMRSEFRNRVVYNGGRYTTTKSALGIRDTYYIGNIHASLTWHSTPSTNDVVKMKRSDLRRIARYLGIDKDWKKYSNENTIYMATGSQMIMF